MKVIIGDLKVELTLAHEFRQIVTYIESEYSRKSKEIGVNYPPTHVFDEDMSVKWNREKVESENANKIAQRDKLRLERKVMYDTMYEYLKLYVEEYLGEKEVSATFVNHMREYLRNHHDSDWPCAVDGFLEILLLYKGELSK